MASSASSSSAGKSSLLQRSDEGIGVETYDFPHLFNKPKLREFNRTELVLTSVPSSSSGFYSGTWNEQQIIATRIVTTLDRERIMKLASFIR